MSSQRESTSESGLVAALCPRCRTVATGDDVETLRSLAKDHDDRRHDSERVTRTVKPKRKHVEAFLARVARRYDAATADDLRRRMDDVAPWNEIADREGIDG